MSPGDEIKRGMQNLKQAVKRAAGEARAQTPDGEDTHKVNMAGRTNVVVAKNVGGQGAKQGTSSRQTTRIRQQDGETYEETETTSTL